MRTTQLLAVVTATLCAAVTVPERLTAQGSVPAAPESLATAQNRIVLALPDSGGYLLNHTPVDSALIDAHLQAIYERRPSKVLLLLPGAHRRPEDLAWVASVARRRGILVYLADRAVESGGLRAL